MLITVDKSFPLEISWRGLRQRDGAFSHPMVEFIDTFSDVCVDSSGGCVEAPSGYFARAGKWVLRYDGLGFVSGRKFRSTELAGSVYSALGAWYDEWSDLEDCQEDDPDWDEYVSEVESCESYYHYCAGVAGEAGEVPHSYEVWQRLGKPGLDR